MRKQKENLVEAMDFYYPPPEQNRGLNCLPNANRELIEPMEFFDGPFLSGQSVGDLQKTREAPYTETKVTPLSFLNTDNVNTGGSENLISANRPPTVFDMPEQTEKSCPNPQPKAKRSAPKITPYQIKEKLLQKESILVLQDRE